MARLSGMQNAEIVAPPKMVTNPSTNRARRITLLMWRTPLPLKTKITHMQRYFSRPISAEVARQQQKSLNRSKSTVADRINSHLRLFRTASVMLYSATVWKDILLAVISLMTRRNGLYNGVSSSYQHRARTLQIAAGKKANLPAWRVRGFRKLRSAIMNYGDSNTWADH